MLGSDAIVTTAQTERGDPQAVRRWLVVVAPTAADQQRLVASYGIPEELIEHSLDTDERPRTDKKDGAALIVLRVPVRESPQAAVPYSTIPLGLIVTEQVAIAVCSRENEVVTRLRALNEAGQGPLAKHRVVLHALQTTADAFLAELAVINAAVDVLENRLRESLANREVLEILSYQKSLVYFTTALQSMELLVKRLQSSPTFHVPPEDEGLLEDVLIEIRQAIDVGTISRDILSEMMDAFASIISNNLNIVMKFLAAFTVILTFPVAIASFYGMNVLLPLQHHKYAFWMLLAVSVLVSAFVATALRRKRWL